MRGNLWFLLRMQNLLQMENKYYTPDISDLFVGYECELEDPTWRPILVSKHYLPRAITKLANRLIRTSYLTKEQIGKEGWEIKDVFNDEMTHTYPCSFRAEKKIDDICVYRIKWTNEFSGRILKIGAHLTLPTLEKTLILFIGKCPSINEFRKICKLLGI